MDAHFADRRALRTLATIAAGILAVALVACSEGRPEDDEVRFPGLGAGGEAADEECVLPCLFGSECVDGLCVVPCEPACGATERCVLGFCVGGDDEGEPERAGCAPACARDAVCDEGECVPAGCDPPCGAGRTCTRTGACIADDACRDDRDCQATDACVGGACVPPIDPEAYEPAPITSYVWDISLPEPLGPDDCCFDMNGDGENDNAIAALAALLATFDFTDVQGDWEYAIEEGILGYVFEFRGLEVNDQDIDLGVLRVSNDLDGDGDADQGFFRRVSGDGVFELDRDSVTRYGPETRFPRARLVGSRLSSGVSDFIMAFPPGALLASGDDPVFYRIQDARIEGSLLVDGDRVSSREVPIDEDETVGSIRLGGAIAAEDWVDELNLGALGCGCLGMQSGATLFYVKFDGDQLVIECNESVDLERCLEREDDCGALPAMCRALPLISRVGPWDVDVDGDGRFESASIGLRLRLTPAELAR